MRLLTAATCLLIAAAAGAGASHWLSQPADPVPQRGAVRLVHQGRETRLDKPSRCVHPGDLLTFVQNGEVTTLRVEALGERRGPAEEARALYSRLTT